MIAATPEDVAAVLDEFGGEVTLPGLREQLRRRDQFLTEEDVAGLISDGFLERTTLGVCLNGKAEELKKRSQQQKHTAPKIEKECATCRKLFLGAPQAKYCSNCRATTGLWPKICADCGKEFQPRSGVQKRCDECRQAGRSRMKPKAAPAPVAEEPKPEPTPEPLGQMLDQEREKRLAEAEKPAKPKRTARRKPKVKTPAPEPESAEPGDQIASDYLGLLIRLREAIDSAQWYDLAKVKHLLALDKRVKERK